MRTILGEIYSLKTQSDNADLSETELAIRRAERQGQIAGLETALKIINEKNY